MSNWQLAKHEELHYRNINPNGNVCPLTTDVYRFLVFDEGLSFSWFKK